MNNDNDSEYIVRLATRADREPFLNLWLDYLKENADLGSPVLPSRYNMTQYRDLFDSYTVGSLRGTPVIASTSRGGVGVLMAGEPPGGFHLETSRGRLMEVWGVYVVPEHRRRGLAHKMQDHGRRVGIDLGFRGAVSTVADNAAARANALNWGAEIDGSRIYRRFGRGH